MPSVCPMPISPQKQKEEKKNTKRKKKNALSLHARSKRLHRLQTPLQILQHGYPFLKKKRVFPPVAIGPFSNNSKAIVEMPCFMNQNPRAKNPRVCVVFSVCQEAPLAVDRIIITKNRKRSAEPDLTESWYNNDSKSRKEMESREEKGKEIIRKQNK